MDKVLVQQLQLSNRMRSVVKSYLEARVSTSPLFKKNMETSFLLGKESFITRFERISSSCRAMRVYRRTANSISWRNHL